MKGFELLFATISQHLRSKNDVLVAVLHFDLIQNGFRCLGIGENFGEESENGSELLAKDWNEDQETYVLRYFNHSINQKLLVKCVQVSDVLIISALIINGESNGSTLSIKAEDFITNNFNTFDSAFIDNSVDRLSKTLNEEIIKKVMSRSEQSESVNKKSEQQRERPVEGRTDPLRIEDPRQPLQGFPPFYEDRRFPPPIGGADLDPFGGGVGGMLMDPRDFPPLFVRGRNPGPGLPRGAVPPGARFDPFGPPGVGPNFNPNPNRNPRNANPDPDHLPPPGYDDMFM